MKLKPPLDSNTAKKLDLPGNAARLSRPDILGQVLATTRYEMMLQARRGATWIAMAAVQTAVIGFMLYLSWRRVSTNQPYLTSSQDISFQVSSSMIETLPLVPLLLMALLPLTLADTVPAERRNNVIEILKYLMLSPGIYLAGKVLGAMGVLAVALLVTTLAQIVLAAVIVGSVDVLFLIQIASVLWVPLLVYVVSISILLPARFFSRRWAWAIAILFSLVGSISAFPTLTGSHSLILDLLFPARSPALRFLQTCSYTALLQQNCPLPLRVVLASVVPAGVQSLLVWVLARRWFT